MRKWNFYEVAILYEFVQCDSYENIKCLEKKSMKVHPYPTYKHNRQWGASKSYENVQMTLYEIIQISHQFSKLFNRLSNMQYIK